MYKTNVRPKTKGRRASLTDSKRTRKLLEQQRHHRLQRDKQRDKGNEGLKTLKTTSSIVLRTMWDCSKLLQQQGHSTRKGHQIQSRHTELEMKMENVDEDAFAFNICTAYLYYVGGRFMVSYTFIIISQYHAVDNNISASFYV